MAQKCATLAKTAQGELKECGSTPCWCQPQQPTVGPQHSLPDLKPKLATMKAAQKTGWPDIAPVPFLNPDPIACLVGHSNEAPSDSGSAENDHID